MTLTSIARSMAALAMVATLPAGSYAQPPQGGGAPAAPGQGRGGPGAAAPSARAAAPVDLTGYWVSIVTEDWIERMSPQSPPSGAVNAGPGGFGGGGRRGGGPGPQAPTSTDPCRAYGAAGSLRVPGRLHITWADDNTLKIDMDAGTQTRLLHFAAAPAQAGPTLQGYSVARWETGGGRGRGGAPPGGGGARGGGAGAPAAPRWGSLTATTTNMAPGYLLSQRAYYSGNAVLTEHFTRHTSFGVDYITVTAVVEDGGQARITSSTFKKEPDGSKFKPGGCELVPAT